MKLQRYWRTLVRVVVASAFVMGSGLLLLAEAHPAIAAATQNAPTAGYWLVASDGGIFSFGDARFYGSTGSLSLNRPVVGMAATPDGAGYWLVASDGGVFAFGDAQFYGSTGSFHLNESIVGMAATPDGAGYWLVASDGGIFAFGDAGYFGSLGADPPSSPVVAIAASSSGGGYWLTSADGSDFAFGNAVYRGGPGAVVSAIVGMAPAPDDNGYWLVSADGAVDDQGSARFIGQLGSAPASPVVGVSPTFGDGGYWLAASDGGVFAFGDAPFLGSMGGLRLNAPVVGVAAPRPPLPSGQTSGAPDLADGQSLLSGQSLDDLGYTLGVGADGALTASDPSGVVLWSAPGTAGHRGAYLTMQQDGDLVERSLQGLVLWQSGTSGSGECVMADQTTGTSLVMAGGLFRWPVFSISPCYSGLTGGPAVAVIGDSITLYAQSAIAGDLGGAYAYLISGQYGRTIGEQQPAVVADLLDPDGPPSDVIVNLGTNDALDQTSGDSFWASAYQTMVASLMERSCVILTTVNTNADASSSGTVAVQINAAEAQTVADHPNFHLVDWNGLVHTGGNQVIDLQSDGIHPTAAGDAALASLYLGALQDACGG